MTVLTSCLPIHGSGPIGPGSRIHRSAGPTFPPCTAHGGGEIAMGAKMPAIPTQREREPLAKIHLRPPGQDCARWGAVEILIVDPPCRPAGAGDHRLQPRLAGSLDQHPDQLEGT